MVTSWFICVYIYLWQTMIIKCKNCFSKRIKNEGKLFILLIHIKIPCSPTTKWFIVSCESKKKTERALRNISTFYRLVYVAFWYDPYSVIVQQRETYRDCFVIFVFWKKNTQFVRGSVWYYFRLKLCFFYLQNSNIYPCLIKVLLQTKFWLNTYDK